MSRFADRLTRGSPERQGVLPNQHLEMAIEDGIVAGDDGAGIPPGNIQPASLDLRLGPVAYRLQCSFLPDRYTVEQRMDGLIMGAVDLTHGPAVLEKTRPYLIPLKERLRLPAEMRARANPKSSTGRADVFTRVITDRSYTFDEITYGYEGPLYLEVVPLSFAVAVQEGLSLNQLRLSLGHAKLTDAELRDAHREHPLLRHGSRPVSERDFAVANGLFLGLNLHGDKDGQVGYRARENAPLLDLTKVRETDPSLYWDPVYRRAGDRIVLEPKHFYLLMSDDAVTIPPHLAAEMTAYDPTSGELRTHYAGFFDPGFGYDPHNQFAGSTAALEVRAHDVAFMVEHRQRVCKLTFERMLEPPTRLYGQGISSHYQRQSSTLGKHFLEPLAEGGRRASRPKRPAPGEDQLELPVTPANRT